MSRLANVVLPLLGLALLACGDDERLAPVDTGEGGAGPGSSSVSTGTGEPEPPPPPPPIREIFQREPFGNVAETHNLLWDGDFEWQSAFADQYGWIEGFAYGVRRPVVGADCRSGLKCARLGPDSAIVGIGMASAEADLYVSVWVKPEATSCATMEVALFADGLDGDADDAPIPPTTESKGEDGWCHYEAVVPQRNDKAYVYVRQPLPGAFAIVDDVVLRRATVAESNAVPRHGASVPTARLVEKIDEARATVRRLRGPRDGAPDPLKRALEREGRGEGRRVFRLAAPRGSK